MSVWVFPSVHLDRGEKIILYTLNFIQYHTVPHLFCRKYISKIIQYSAWGGGCVLFHPTLLEFIWLSKRDFNCYFVSDFGICLRDWRVILMKASFLCLYQNKNKEWTLTTVLLLALQSVLSEIGVLPLWMLICIDWTVGCRSLWYIPAAGERCSSFSSSYIVTIVQYLFLTNAIPNTDLLLPLSPVGW